MHPKRNNSFILFLLLMFSVFLYGAQPAFSADPVRVVVNQSYVLSVTGIQKIQPGDEAIATAQKLSKDQIVITGKKVGTTNIIVWDEKGKDINYTIIVMSSDPESIASELKKTLKGIDGLEITTTGENVLLDGELSSNKDAKLVRDTAAKYPNIVKDSTRISPVVKEILAKEAERVIDIRGIRIRIAADKIFLEGKVPTKEEADRAQTIAKSYLGEEVINLLQISDKVVSRNALIQLNVQIIEVRKTTRKNIGINWPEALTFQEESVLPGIFRINKITRQDPLWAKLNALFEEGTARIIAKPNLITISGGKAKFLAGGEMPVPITQPGGGGGGGITINWKEYGVKVEIEPTVDATNSFINAKVKPEYSGIDKANGIVLEGAEIPAITNRSIETEVQIEIGETLLIAGMLKTDEQEMIQRVPVLGSLPIIGWLFTHKSPSLEQSELAIFVTPTLLASESKGQQ